MAKPGFANAGAAIRVCDDVENDVVRARGIARNSANSRQRVGGGQMIETEEISHSPGDVVVRAGGVAAYAHSADDLMALSVETQAATKDVHAADLISDHRIRRSAVARRRSRVGYARVDRIAVLYSIKATAGFDGR